ncbi:MAG: glycosyltransferase family 1 protein, partial [Pseudomonadota bacterium]|nr:glycosyltransferase family 1 protein [Pseudomonadota bacterium]
MSLKPVRLAYFVTHPIQYQAPLLRMIAADPSIELKVFFATDHSLTQHYDPGFGREIAWDVDMINGYEHEVLPALNPGASLSTLNPFSVGVAWRVLTGG